MYELPTSVELNGEPFKIRENGDFRMVLHLFEIMNADDLDDQERTIASLMVFYEDLNGVEDVIAFPYIEDAVKQMFWFINCGQEEDKKASEAKLIDWEADSTLIASAINKVAGKEIRAEKFVHWWTFIAYYMAIGECALSQVVSIRYKMAHGQKLEKYERKFKQDNPQYFRIDMRSKDQKIAEDYVQALWNGGNE